MEPIGADKRCIGILRGNLFGLRAEGYNPTAFGFKGTNKEPKATLNPELKSPKP